MTKTIYEGKGQIYTMSCGKGHPQLWISIGSLSVCLDEKNAWISPNLRTLLKEKKSGARHLFKERGFLKVK